MFSYYGRLDGELLGRGLGEYMLDQAWDKIIERHETKLDKIRCEFASKVRDELRCEIAEFRLTLSRINARLVVIEKTLKENKDAIKEIREQKSDGREHQGGNECGEKAISSSGDSILSEKKGTKKG